MPTGTSWVSDTLNSTRPEQEEFPEQWAAWEISSETDGWVCVCARGHVCAFIDTMYVSR